MRDLDGKPLLKQIATNNKAVVYITWDITAMFLGTTKASYLTSSVRQTKSLRATPLAPPTQPTPSDPSTTDRRPRRSSWVPWGSSPL
ncbi:hypothetical protein FOYG_12802 [Fusarium oxysporum NRRL 32931]|uniref:Uncharacterized protein n=1 Tax=Fusarium oxysporum NRRL 32931 TaxID=660029 RepID=W9HXC6_FUSOX|nr:hypothetical protein FOYG_12802 [Fusarium oxysporum NRRL 32931]